MAFDIDRFARHPKATPHVAAVHMTWGTINGYVAAITLSPPPALVIH